jgi:hypothetical protein
MAKHDVTFMVPERSLGKADLVFRVKGDGEMVGRLKVSHGAVVWMPKNGKLGYSVSWQRFDRLMQEGGRKLRVR